MTGWVGTVVGHAELHLQQAIHQKKLITINIIEKQTTLGSVGSPSEQHPRSEHSIEPR